MVQLQEQSEVILIHFVALHESVHHVRFFSGYLGNFWDLFQGDLFAGLCYYLTLKQVKALQLQRSNLQF